MMIAYPFDGTRKTGKLLPRNTFRSALEKIIKAKDCTCGGFSMDRGEDECDCLSAVEKRRLKFVKTLIAAGIPYFKINTHSWRKGAGSAAASGSTVAPPIMAICIRAGWKIYAMLEKYLSLENAGDFFLGRVVAGLPQDTKQFGVLPPRFKADLTLEQNRMIEQVYETCFPNDSRWGNGMTAVFRHLLATVAYHKDYLQALPHSHPFRMSWLSLNPLIFDQLHETVELKYDGDDLTCRFLRFSATLSPHFHISLFRHIVTTRMIR